MATKKKRNKQYHGRDAAVHTTVTRVAAVKRNPVSQWWVDHKRVAKPAAKVGGVVIAILLIIIGIISIFLPH